MRVCGSKYRWLWQQRLCFVTGVNDCNDEDDDNDVEVTMKEVDENLVEIEMNKATENEKVKASTPVWNPPWSLSTSGEDWRDDDFSNNEDNDDDDYYCDDEDHGT